MIWYGMVWYDSSDPVVKIGGTLPPTVALNQPKMKRAFFRAILG